MASDRPAPWLYAAQAILVDLGLRDDFTPWLAGASWEVHVMAPGEAASTGARTPGAFTLCDVQPRRRRTRSARELRHAGVPLLGAGWVRDRRLADWHPTSRGSGDRRCTACLQRLDDHGPWPELIFDPYDWLTAAARDRHEQAVTAEAERVLRKLVADGKVDDLQQLWERMHTAERASGESLLWQVWAQDVERSVRAALGADWTSVRRRLLGAQGIFGGDDRLVDLAGERARIAPALASLGTRRAAGVAGRRDVLIRALLSPTPGTRD